MEARDRPSLAQRTDFRIICRESDGRSTSCSWTTGITTAELQPVAVLVEPVHDELPATAELLAAAERTRLCMVDDTLLDRFLLTGF